MLTKKYDKDIIIALDYLTSDDAKNIVKKLKPDLCRVKVGKALFTATGPDLIKWLQDKGFEVFLDLKYHDIPNTVYNACLAAANLGVWMVNVHTFGGLEMLKSAKAGALASNAAIKPLVIGVTVLTSFDETTLKSLGITEDINTQVLKLAQLASMADLDGLVCSAQEAKLLKHNFHNLKLVTPGIRLHAGADDQKRVMTPKDALMAGSDYLVIGREITGAADPIQALENIIASLA